MQIRWRVRGWGSSNSDDWKENLALSLICDNEKNHLPKIPNEKQFTLA